MINESRRAQRRNVHEPVVVVDTMTEQVLGRIGNISETGMLLVTTGHLVPIDVGVHVAWMGSANTPGQGWAGVRFLTLEEAPLAVLRHWIARPEVRH